MADNANSNEELELARTNYFEVVGKKVPNNKKNDLDWINAAIKKHKALEKEAPVAEEVVAEESNEDELLERCEVASAQTGQREFYNGDRVIVVKTGKASYKK